MRRKLRVYTVGIFIFCLTIMSLFQHAHALGESQQSGFSVSPAQLSFTVQADTPTQTANLKLTNSYDSPLRLTAELQSIDELGARLIPDGPIDERTGKSIKVSATDITVPARGSFDLQVTVDGTFLTDGGHYASLVLAQQSNAGSTAGFHSAVAVNLFIIKNEHIRMNLQLMNHTFDRPLLSLPKTVSLVFRNEGNTHIVPRASVMLYDGEDIVSKAVVNTSSTLLLPGHQEKFTVKLDTLKRFWLPRRLIARTMYRVEGSDIQLMKEQVLWHVPFVDIIAVIALGLAAWRWRSAVRATYTRLKMMAKRRISAKKSKKASTHASSRAVTKNDTVVLQEKANSASANHEAVMRGTMPSPAQNGATPRHISIQTQTSLPSPKSVVSPVKRIAITLKEEAVESSTKTAPKKRANATKKQSATRTKAQSKPKTKKTTSAAKKPAAKLTKKKTS
jgi:hypothetical protein